MSETMKFEELNIKPEILRAVEDMGFEEAGNFRYFTFPESTCP